MRRVTLLLASPLLAGLALAACSGGGDAPLQAEPAAAVQSGYRILPERSEVRVTGTQQGESFTGTFESFDAAIDFDADDLENARVRVSLPIASLDLGSSDRNDALPGKVWFSTRLHPVAVFEADTFRTDGDGYVADGTLTVKGLRRGLSLPFTLEDEGGLTVMRGSVVLDRTRWNLGDAPWDTEEYVGHDVRVDVELVAEPLD